MEVIRASVYCGGTYVPVHIGLSKRAIHFENEPETEVY